MGLEVWAYCLMTNHVHWVVVPPAAEALGRAMRVLNSQYTAGVNRRQGFSGHLWQGRFYSTPLDETHLWTAVRYVECNPVRAGRVEQAWQYPWSSAAAHCGLRRDSLLKGSLETLGSVTDWQAFLRDVDDTAERKLRQCTGTGRPCGGPAFLDKLEGLLGRSLRPAKRGPKPRGNLAQKNE